MFAARNSVALLDYFRIPYALDSGLVRLPERHPLQAGGAVSYVEDGAAVRTLFWPALDFGAGALSRYRIGSATLVADLIPDDVSSGWFNALGAGWRKVVPIVDSRGAERASIWRDEAGNVFLPFDPNEAIHTLLSERYRIARGTAATWRLRAAAAWSYYRLRPALARGLQMSMRRAFGHAQARASFPRWPIEPSLHDFYDLVLGLLADVARDRIPFIAPWPDHYSWALVLTHDVETDVGYQNLDLLRSIELDLDLRSAWGFVPRRYDVSDQVVRKLDAAGFEVAVHGLYHDGRDLESLSMLWERLPAIRSYAERWGAVGFRSPAMRRSWELMPLLGFDYDSSYPDTDPFGPDGGGCGSWLPVMNGDLVELPVTLPQDHTLFEILGETDERAWCEKAEYLRGRGGMALLITHPDYMLEPERLESYSRFLETFRGDEAMWTPLPREVSAWWRRRGNSHLLLERGEWTVQGEARGEARVEYVEPGSPVPMLSHALPLG